MEGIENARFEAIELLGCAGVDRTKLYTEPISIRDLLPEVRQRAAELLGRRVNGEPLQYIIGEWEFYGLPFKVGEGVLIPRQDTETLVEMALDFLKTRPPEQRRTLDLCAGTGCIGITLAKLANSDVSCVEFSGAAFGYLAENVWLNDVEERVKPIYGDIFDSEIRRGLGEFDLIISNPPYLTDLDMRNLQTEVTHEPKMALYGGSDGLDFYWSIVCEYTASVKTGGAIFFEVGAGQAAEVARILSESGFETSIVKDLCKIERVVCGIKSP
ncbi:MAG: peptide chain release factor N(5)-glutamine methyltransferase [Oscillospiraceae bacterium]|nr:peptide chain release factor N(5)-glutamine methyltransferase [Oscillospiraceae bacterium]